MSAFPFLLLSLIVIVVVVAIAIVIIATVIVTIIIRTVAAQSAGLARWRDLPQAAGYPRSCSMAARSQTSKFGQRSPVHLLPLPILLPLQPPFVLAPRPPGASGSPRTPPEATGSPQKHKISPNK